MIRQSLTTLIWIMQGFNPGISPNKDAEGLFRFQGYQIYQLSRNDVSLSELDDVSKARLVAQVDLKDTVTTLYNWTAIDNPSHIHTAPDVVMIISFGHLPLK